MLAEVVALSPNKFHHPMEKFQYGGLVTYGHQCFQSSYSDHSRQNWKLNCKELVFNFFILEYLPKSSHFCLFIRWIPIYVQVIQKIQSPTEYHVGQNIYFFTLKKYKSKFEQGSI